MTTDMTATALTLIAALAVLLGLLWAALWGVRRIAGRRGPAGPGKALRVLGATYVGVKKTVTLVEVPGAVLVLGVTPERIGLLQTIDDPVLVEQVTGRRVAGGGGNGFARELAGAEGRMADGA